MSLYQRAINGLAAAIVVAPTLTLPAAAQPLHVPITEPLRLAAPVRPVKSPTAVYIVKLKAPGAATYKGTVSGFAATKPSNGQRLDIHSAAVQTYVRLVEQSHERLLGAEQLLADRPAIVPWRGRPHAEVAQDRRQMSRLLSGDHRRTPPDCRPRVTSPCIPCPCCLAGGQWMFAIRVAAHIGAPSTIAPR